jgi:glycosyltransferase involved in cell wall biosynthesis
MVKVLHATDYFNRANTGITRAVGLLLEQTVQYCPTSKLGLISLPPVDVSVPPGTVLKVVTPETNSLAARWRYAPGFGAATSALIDELGGPILHVHGIWLHPQFAAIRAAMARHRPIILTNHGHLEAWALRQPGRLGALKKQLYLQVMQQFTLNKVSVFHAISPLNQSMVHRLFPGARIELIPNSIDLGAMDAQISGRKRNAAVAPYIPFIGRLMPQKGVDLLIKAFELAQISRDCRLVIVGPVENVEYADYLRRLIANSSKRDCIDLRGPVWDNAEKNQLMIDAWLVAVPSRSEVVALVNLEAAACYTPTLTTIATGLKDWEDGGGILVEAEILQIAAGLSKANYWDESERKARGEASRRLVERRYSTAITAPRWIELYRSLS